MYNNEVGYTPAGVFICFEVLNDFYTEAFIKFKADWKASSR